MAATQNDKNDTSCGIYEDEEVGAEGRAGEDDGASGADGKDEEKDPAVVVRV